MIHADKILIINLCNGTAVSTDCFGYNENDIVMLTDDQTDPWMLPTQANIVGFVSFLSSLH